ncbi:hypothetical protein ES703_84671 [subsurface metagenome]
MGLFGISFPWETPAGEGFIAPWTPKVETPAGTIQASVAQPGDQLQSGLLDIPGMGPGTAPPSRYTPSIPREATFQPQPVVAPAARYTPPPEPGDDLEAEDKGGLFGTGLFAPPDLASRPPMQVQELGVPAAITPGGALWPTIAAAGTGLATLALSRLKLPWETAPGEGIIAPWTQQQQLPSGLWGQEGVQYGNGQAAPAIAGLAGMSYAQLKGGVPVKSWTNASKDGRIPASVNFVKFSNGMMASQSLVDGQIKTWRPKKHVVISSNPRMSAIRKLDNLHKRTIKKLIKMKGLKSG